MDHRVKVHNLKDTLLQILLVAMDMVATIITEETPSGGLAIKKQIMKRKDS